MALTNELSLFVSHVFGDVQIGRHHGQANFAVGNITAGGAVYLFREMSLARIEPGTEGFAARGRDQLGWANSVARSLCSGAKKCRTGAKLYERPREKKAHGNYKPRQILTKSVAPILAPSLGPEEKLQLGRKPADVKIRRQNCRPIFRHHFYLKTD